MVARRDWNKIFDALLEDALDMRLLCGRVLCDEILDNCSFKGIYVEATMWVSVVGEKRFDSLYPNFSPAVVMWESC